MASPRIWYYPAGMINGATLEEIDFSTGIRAIDESPDWRGNETETLSGRVYTTQFSSRLRIRLVHERFSSASLYRSLATLETHLNRGGVISFTRDNTKAYAGYAQGGKARGTTALLTAGNTWDYGQSTVTLASSDEMVVAAPSGLREWRTLSAHSPTTRLVTLGSGLVYDYTLDPWLLVRWRDYFPAMRRAPGDRTPILTTERRIVHSFQVELVEDWSVLTAFSGFEEGILRGSSANERTFGLDLGDAASTLGAGVVTVGSRF